MSGDTQSIVCRRCNEVISTEVDDCPHCGKSRQGRGPWAAIIIGVILLIPSVIQGGELLFFALVGLVLIAIGGWLVRDERQRKQQAAERAIQENSEI